MAIGQAVVGSQAFGEGATPNTIREGREGDLIVSQLHGGFFEQTRRGNLYMYNTGGAGITVLKYDNTGPALVLWNKSASVNLELVEFGLTWIATPAVAGSIGLGIIPVAGTGLAVATGSSVTAFTELATVLRMKDFASVNPPYGKCATASTIVALAAGALIPIFSLPGAMAAASTTTAPYETTHQFRGDLLIPPGAAVVVCSNVAQTVAMGVRLSWVEPIPV